MPENERNGHRTGYNRSRFNDGENLELMNKKMYFDDDRRDIPAIKSSVPGINRKLKIFTGKGDWAVVKIDKEMPDVGIAARNIFWAPSTSVLILNSGIGAVGLALATTNPETQFYLYDSSVQNALIMQRNLDINFECSKNTAVISDPESKGAVESIVYDISAGYSALQVIKDNISLSKKLLKEKGEFYCITYTRAGAERHEKITRDIFGDDNVTIFARGNGGYRIIKAVKGDNSVVQTQPESEKVVKFSVLGKEISLITEPGLFSKEDLDAGTRFLLEGVDLTSYNRLLDLGCGWGAIGITASILNPRGKVVMIDVDLRAVKIAQENVARLCLGNQVKVFATNNVSTLEGNFDLVLSNPPFHADTQILIDVFKNVRKVLNKKGKVYLVIEKTYLDKFERVIDGVFGRHKIVKSKGSYYILGI